MVPHIAVREQCALRLLKATPSHVRQSATWHHIPYSIYDGTRERVCAFYPGPLIERAPLSVVQCKPGWWIPG